MIVCLCKMNSLPLSCVTGSPFSGLLYKHNLLAELKSPQKRDERHEDIKFLETTFLEGQIFIFPEIGLQCMKSACDNVKKSDLSLLIASRQSSVPTIKADSFEWEKGVGRNANTSNVSDAKTFNHLDSRRRSRPSWMGVCKKSASFAAAGVDSVATQTRRQRSRLSNWIRTTNQKAGTASPLLVMVIWGHI